MELLVQYSAELIKLSAFGVVIGGILVAALAMSTDSGKFDSKETRIFVQEKEFEKK